MVTRLSCVVRLPFRRCGCVARRQVCRHSAAAHRASRPDAPVSPAFCGRNAPLSIWTLLAARAIRWRAWRVRTEVSLPTRQWQHADADSYHRRGG